VKVGRETLVLTGNFRPFAFWGVKLWFRKPHFLCFQPGFFFFGGGKLWLETKGNPPPLFCGSLLEGNIFVT